MSQNARAVKRAHAAKSIACPECNAKRNVPCRGIAEGTYHEARWAAFRAKRKAGVKQRNAKAVGRVRASQRRLGERGWAEDTVDATIVRGGVRVGKLQPGDRKRTLDSEQGSLLYHSLRRLGMSYADYMATNHWHRVRNAAINAQRKCQVCGVHRELVVHHSTYRNFGQEEASDLVVLCFRHHEAVHDLHVLDRVPLEQAHIVLRQRLADEVRDTV